MGDSHEGKAMHPLLDKIYGKVFPRAEKSIRIVVLGSPGVGKTGKESFLIVTVFFLICSNFSSSHYFIGL